MAHHVSPGEQGYQFIGGELRSNPRSFLAASLNSFASETRKSSSKSTCADNVDKYITRKLFPLVFTSSRGKHHYHAHRVYASVSNVPSFLDGSFAAPKGHNCVNYGPNVLNIGVEFRLIPARPVLSSFLMATV
jgi:hypothetical protein